MASES